MILKSLASLIHFNPNCSERIIQNVIHTQSPFPLKPTKPKLIVCHDFKGGYLPHETANQITFMDSASLDLCNLSTWQFIDVFIYFSHNRVSIPPPSWISCAKKHNTIILGSVLTEHWQPNGIEDTDEIGAKAATISEDLVQLAKHFSFGIQPKHLYIPIARFQSTFWFCTLKNSDHYF